MIDLLNQGFFLTCSIGIITNQAAHHFGAGGGGRISLGAKESGV